jgi:hypothetical protein
VFATSLKRPELVSEAELHEAVAEVLDSDRRLKVERNVRAGRRIADFRVRRGDRAWLVEVKGARGSEPQRRIREGVDQLDELLRWFRLTKGVLVVPDKTTLPTKRSVERPGGISILIERLSDLTHAFD